MSEEFPPGGLPRQQNRRDLIRTGAIVAANGGNEGVAVLRRGYWVVFLGLGASVLI